MGVEDAADLWGLSPTQIKRLCREDKVIAKKFGNTWILLKKQPSPAQPDHPKNWRGRLAMNYTVTAKPVVGYDVRSKSVGSEEEALKLAKDEVTEGNIQEDLFKNVPAGDKSNLAKEIKCFIVPKMVE